MAFDHVWTFGRNTSVPVKNLTTASQHKILFAASNKAVLYDYAENSIQMLQVHHHEVTFLSVDSSGRWLVTGDSGNHNTIIIWDAKQGTPIRCLFDKFPSKITNIYLSPCGKYLLVLYGESLQRLDLWEWANDQETSDAHMKLPKGFGKVRSISFSDKTEWFLLTSSSNVLFCTYRWDEIQSHIPNFDSNHTWVDIGNFTDSLYLPGTQNAISGTDRGYLTIWSDADELNKTQSKPISNKKNGKVQLSLQAEPIEILRHVDKLVMTANSRGTIAFYDYSLHLLFWYKRTELINLIDVSFHIKPLQHNIDLKAQSGEEMKGEKIDVAEWEKVYKPLHDTTLERNLFEVRDCIISTSSGSVAYLNFSRDSFKYLALNFFGTIKAIDVYPKEKYVCVGSDLAKLFIIDYTTKKICMEKDIIAADYVTLDLQKGLVSSISFIKYSPNGICLACGQEDGSLWFFRPITLGLMFDSPYHHSSQGIMKIDFSTDSEFMAVADKSNCVCLYLLGTSVVLLGKYQVHFKTINDFLFIPGSMNQHRLFSVGNDRNLVEFNLSKKQKEKVIIKSVNRIDQAGIPLCLAVGSGNSSTIIVSNTEYKFRMINTETKACIKTTQAPLLNAPVNSLMVVPGNTNYFIYSAGNQIGLQKLPLDGNPYKYISCTASSSPIVKACCSSTENYLFTVPEKGTCFSMWSYNLSAIDALENLGGTGMDPYNCLLEGGRDGDFIHEIEDFFIFFQMIHEGEYILNERSVGASLPFCELIDVMRSLGFYPSNYETECILSEIKQNKNLYPGNGKITFEEFVKLFINHRHVLDITENTLKDAFNTFLDPLASSGSSAMRSTRFINMLEQTGERFTREETISVLRALIPPKSMDDDESRLNFLPEVIDFTYFIQEILGLDKHKSLMKSSKSLQGS